MGPRYLRGLANDGQGRRLPQALILILSPLQHTVPE